MPMVQLRHMRMIMSEGQVPMRVSMGFQKEDLSVMGMVVMFSVQMDVVVFQFLMRVGMRVMRAEKQHDSDDHQGSGSGVLNVPSLA